MHQRGILKLSRGRGQSRNPLVPLWTGSLPGPPSPSTSPLYSSIIIRNVPPKKDTPTTVDNNNIENSTDCVNSDDPQLRQMVTEMGVSPSLQLLQLFRHTHGSYPTRGVCVPTVSFLFGGLVLLPAACVGFQGLGWNDWSCSYGIISYYTILYLPSLGT